MTEISLAHVTTSRAPAGRRWKIVALVWSAALTFVVARAFVLERIVGQAPVRGQLANEIIFILMWAAATPAILRSAARFPVAGPGWPRRLALHALFGTLFVAAINAVGPFLLRLALGVPIDAAAALKYGASMFAQVFHLALVVYALIVVVGHYARDVDARREESTRNAAIASTADDARREPAPAPRVGEELAPLPHAPLAVKADGRLRLIEQAAIDWVEADDDHVIVHAGSIAWRSRERLADIERRLDPARFVRIHRSTIVQVSRVRELEPWFHGDYVVVMQSGAKLRLSRTRRERVAALLGRAL